MWRCNFPKIEAAGQKGSRKTHHCATFSSICPPAWVLNFLNCRITHIMRRNVSFLIGGSVVERRFIDLKHTDQRWTQHLRFQSSVLHVDRRLNFFCDTLPVLATRKHRLNQVHAGPTRCGGNPCSDASFRFPFVCLTSFQHAQHPCLAPVSWRTHNRLNPIHEIHPIVFCLMLISLVLLETSYRFSSDGMLNHFPFKHGRPHRTVAGLE